MTKPIPNDNPQPALPLPPPIRSDRPGTWAYSTMTERLPEIARRTLLENSFTPAATWRVAALAEAVPEEPLRLLLPGAPDTDAWDAYTRPYLEESWLTTPWFFAETYFYRRLLEATGYFRPGSDQGRDPFIFQKEQGLATTMDTTAEIAYQLASWIANGWDEEAGARLLAIDLWGNRADLSLWPAGESGDQPGQMDWDTAVAHTLADDSAAALQHLSRRAPARLDILVDNAGIELVADLALADYLLAVDTAHAVYLHLKPHPTFVSDAMIGDVEQTIRALAGAANTTTAEFGCRLAAYVADGRLQLRDHAFWVSPLPFWEVPAALRAELAASDLILSKGDANYRRLLGDRHWPYTTQFADILAYTPAPLLALRALKAELAAGLTEAQIARLNREDPSWEVNGRWGVIQFAQPAGQL